MSASKPILERECKLVLELVTPLHIGSGEPDKGSDAGVVRDFNGLPGLPGTSLQGMLRSAVRETAGAKAADQIFGRSDQAHADNGRGGRLSVSWGVIHQSSNQPVPGRLLPADRDNDPVLRDAARPMLRDHVRLTERGVADKTGKFDERVVSAGHRFTVTLRLVTGADQSVEADRDWRLLHEVLRYPHLRLGGKSRRGLGAFRIVDATPKQQPSSETVPHTPTELPQPSWKDWSCELTPATLWMFGSGSSEKADSAPVRGTRVVWEGDSGCVQPVWVIPGSAIKGALGHRTRFHAHRIGGNFIDEPIATDIEPWLKGLFGSIQGDSGTPGNVYIDDVFLDIASDANGQADPDRQLAPVQNHVSINPFTGGAKDSALFNDEPLLPGLGRIPLKVRVRTETLPDNALAAFAAALTDLQHGRLALGGHAGRGYGIFQGSTQSQAA